MTSPLERAARALWDDRERHQHPRCRQTWEQGSETARRFAMDHARAVIEAIREPSDAMSQAGDNMTDKWFYGHTVATSEVMELFTAMIDALLAEGV